MDRNKIDEFEAKWLEELLRQKKKLFDQELNERKELFPYRKMILRILIFFIAPFLGALLYIIFNPLKYSSLLVQIAIGCLWGVPTLIYKFVFKKRIFVKPNFDLKPPKNPFKRKAIKKGVSTDQNDSPGKSEEKIIKMISDKPKTK